MAEQHRKNIIDLFVIPNKKGEGYKIVRDEDGYIYEKTYETIKAANDWINYINDLLRNSKVDWGTYSKC